MKNLLKIAFALALALSMTACGGETIGDINNDDPKENIQQENETSEDSAEPEVSEDPVVPESPEEIPENEQPSEEPVESEESENVEEESLFDTGWASNEYEKLIPQPPFDGWTGEMKGENIYELSTSNANADGSGAYYEIFQAYLVSLADYGFSIDGDVYSAAGFDEFGNEFRFKCGDGWAWITIIPMEGIIGGDISDELTDEVDVPADEPIEEVVIPSFSTDWASNDMEKLIPEPPMIIARSYDDGNSWVMTNRISDSRLADEPLVEVTEPVSRAKVLEYIDLLKAYGFIERSPLYENKTEIEDAIGAFFNTPDEKYSITIWHFDDHDMSISIKPLEQ